MPAKPRIVVPALVTLFLVLAAATGWALAAYVSAAEAGVAAIATVLWPRRIAYLFRQGMFGGGGSVWTRQTSLCLSALSSEAGSEDNYDDYEPQDGHLLNAYSGVAFFVVLVGMGRRNWQALLAMAVVLLIGRFVILGLARRDRRTREVP